MLTCQLTQEFNGQITHLIIVLNFYLIFYQFVSLIYELFFLQTYLNFVFDGNNFRGYLTESEIIAKAYANDWAAGISTEVLAEENESYLLEKSDLIRTNDFVQNRKLYLEEGRAWIKKKYGFNSRWTMNQYVKFFYDQFFSNHPELEKYKI